MIANKVLYISRVTGYTPGLQSKYLLRSLDYPRTWSNASVRWNYRNFGHQRKRPIKYPIIFTGSALLLLPSLMNFEALKKMFWPKTKAAEISTESLEAADTAVKDKKIEDGSTEPKKKKKKKEKVGFRDRKVSEL